MKCKTCRTNLIALTRGQLTGEEASRIREHLESCEECRLFADYQNSIYSVIQTEKEITPDPFLATRIEGLLQRPVIRKESQVLRPRLIPALAFSVFILAGIMGGIGLGKLIIPDNQQDQMARNELRILVDDLQQEPLESFILGL